MNKVFLIGRTTTTPELRKTQSGHDVCSFTIAVDRAVSKESKTDFINCVSWGKTAEIISGYISKGNKIALEGSLETRNFTDKDGNKRYTTEVKVDRMEFVERKNSATTDFSTNSTNGFEEMTSDDDLPF